MLNIEYTETDKQGLDLIAPLWQKLIEHHKARSPQYLSRHYDRMTWEIRKKELLEKSRNGFMRIDLARDINTGKLVGYCVSTISEKRQGEIDSIYIEAGYRRCGIGNNLTKRALRWMDSRSVTKKIVAVGAGNEEAFEFYGRYNFYPRATILEQVENKGTDSSPSLRSGSE
jgi:ribosomal protein S18 acetylase RimI-like enzyme